MKNKTKDTYGLAFDLAIGGMTLFGVACLCAMFSRVVIHVWTEAF